MRGCETIARVSQENVEAVRALIEDIWGGPETPDLTGRVDPEVEVIASWDFPGPTQLFGLMGFERWTKRWSGMFDDYDLQPVRFWEQGDRVVVALHERATGTLSRVPVEQHYAHVWTFADGVVVKVQVFRSEDEALEAVGLAH